MKKLFFVIIVSFFLTANAWALSPTFLQLVTGGDPVCDNCSGTLKFAWHMEDDDATPDVTLGNPCGCSDGDTIGAVTGSPVFSTAQKSDGTRSLHINAIDEHYTFVVSSDDIIEPDNIKITFDIYIVSYPASNYANCMSTATNSTNFLRLRLTTGDLQGKYMGGGEADYVGGVVVSTGTWVSCEYQAKTGVAGNDHYIICGETAAEEDDDLVATDGSMTSLDFGDNGGDSAGEFYIDNVKIYPCDRY